LVQIEGYDFEEMDPALERRITKQLLFTFGRLKPVHIAAKRVVGEDGSFVGVRVAAVSYTLPQGVPFGALASEVGREFLGATPQNSSSFLGGKGVYMRSRTDGDPTESVAFFIGEEIFVYFFGAAIEAPTEEIARRLFKANR
jgi:hypothetical protein